jgi:hypothetical protein
VTVKPPTCPHQPFHTSLALMNPGNQLGPLSEMHFLLLSGEAQKAWGGRHRKKRQNAKHIVPYLGFSTAKYIQGLTHLHFLFRKIPSPHLGCVCKQSWCPAIIPLCALGHQGQLSIGGIPRSCPHGGDMHKKLG